MADRRRGDTKRDPARALLEARGLRVTGPRLAVTRLLAAADRPLSYSEVLDLLGDADWDRATLYRNLVKLAEAGVAQVVSRAEGMARYALAAEGDHHHPHFSCEDCGRVVCLPAELAEPLRLAGPWAEAVRTASVHLRGSCPDCRGTRAPR